MTLRTMQITTRAGKSFKIETPYSDNEAIARLSSINSNFAASLSNQYAGNGFLSRSQVAWAHKLCLDLDNGNLKLLPEVDVMSAVINTPAREEPAPESRSEVEAEPETEAGAEFFSIFRMFGIAKGLDISIPKITFDFEEIRIHLKLIREGVGVYSLHDYSTEAPKFHGYISPRGFIPEPGLAATTVSVIKFLEQLNADPVKIAGMYGEHTGTCCFCGEEVHDAEFGIPSRGYHKTCGTNYGLTQTTETG